MDGEVEAAVEVFLAHPHAEQDAILLALTTCGFSPWEAWRLNQFVPIAFYRVVMRPHGIEFEPTYLSIPRDAKQWERRLLADEPVYVAAIRVADRLRSAGATTEALLPVFGRSAEFAGINQLLNRGSQLRDIRLTEQALFEFEGQIEET